MSATLNSFSQFRCCLFFHVRSGAILYGLFRVIFHAIYFCIILSVLLGQFQPLIKTTNSSHFLPPTTTMTIQQPFEFNTTTHTTIRSNNNLHDIKITTMTIINNNNNDNNSFIPLSDSQFQGREKESPILSLIGNFPLRHIIGQSTFLLITILMLHGVTFYHAKLLIPFLLLLIFELTGTLVSFFTLMVNQGVGSSNNSNTNRVGYQKNFSLFDNDAVLFQLVMHRGSNNSHNTGVQSSSSSLFSALLLLCFKSYMVCMIWNCYRYLQFTATQQSHLRPFSNHFQHSNQNHFWSRFIYLIRWPFTSQQQRQEEEEEQNEAASHTLVDMREETTTAALLDSHIPPDFLPPSYEDLINKPQSSNMPPSYTSLELAKLDENASSSSSP